MEIFKPNTAIFDQTITEQAQRWRLRWDPMELDHVQIQPWHDKFIGRPMLLDGYFSRFLYEASVRLGMYEVYHHRAGSQPVLAPWPEVIEATRGHHPLYGNINIQRHAIQYQAYSQQYFRQYYTKFDFPCLAKAFLIGNVQLFLTMASFFSLIEEWFFGNKNLAMDRYLMVEREAIHGYAIDQLPLDESDQDNHRAEALQNIHEDPDVLAYEPLAENIPEDAGYLRASVPPDMNGLQVMMNNDHFMLTDQLVEQPTLLTNWYNNTNLWWNNQPQSTRTYSMPYSMPTPHHHQMMIGYRVRSPHEITPICQNTIPQQHHGLGGSVKPSKMSKGPKMIGIKYHLIVCYHIIPPHPNLIPQ